MELYGNRRRKKKKPAPTADKAAGSEQKSPQAAAPGKTAYSAKRKKALRRALIVVGVIVLAIVGVIVGYSLWEKPPEIAGADKTPGPSASPKPTASARPEPTDEPDPDDPEIDPFDGALLTDRDDGVYTFLLVGRDHQSNSTDTIMVGRLDTSKHSISCVNIPRDTMANISWGSTPKKINAVYPGYYNSGRDPVEGLMTHVKNMVGFDIDCYAVVNLKVVEDVINEIGGVDFDVPIDMDYDDPSQHFHVHLKAGQQHLNGYETLGVFRYRYGNNGNSYPGGDLERIGVQHSLLKSIATQMLSLGNIPNLGNVIQLCLDNVETDLDASNMAFFARQFLMCSPENINFEMAPLISSSSINNISYVSLDVNAWLELINENINPYKEEVTRSNVNILVSNGDGSYIESTTGTIAGGYDSFACNMPGCELRGSYHAPGAHIWEETGGEEGEGVEGEGETAPAEGETETLPAGSGEESSGGDDVPEVPVEDNTVAEPSAEPQIETDTSASDASGGEQGITFDFPLDVG